MKIKTKYLKQLEIVFSELGYKLRYEKGNFRSGYCYVHDSNVVIVNKFFDTQARFDTLQNILSQIQINYSELSALSRKFLSEQGFMRSRA